jgi:PBP1b-binding outer membrane lipoprotein LpoB
MKRLFLIPLSMILFVSCSNSKKTSENNAENKPKAEVPLAPGYVQAMLKITNIEEEGTKNIVSARVIEVLKYGSSTDPVAEGAIIRFYSTDELLSDLTDAYSNNESLNATLSNAQGRMIENSNTFKLWSLITITN